MVTTENFPRLTSDTKPDIQEAHRTPTKINAKKKHCTQAYHIQTEENQRQIKRKFKILEKRGKNLTYRGEKVRTTSNFSETMQGTDSGMKYFEVLRELQNSVSYKIMSQQ